MSWEELCAGQLLPTLVMVVLQLWAILDSSTHPVTTTGSTELSASIFALAQLADQMQPVPPLCFPCALTLSRQVWPYPGDASLSGFQDALKNGKYLTDGLTLTNDYDASYVFAFGNSGNCYINVADAIFQDPSELCCLDL